MKTLLKIKIKGLNIGIYQLIIDVLLFFLMFFYPFSGRKPFCPKLFVRRCYVVKYCYRILRICRCVPFKKYGDETGFDNRLNDEMLETPEDEADNFDEMSKSTVIQGE